MSIYRLEASAWIARSEGKTEEGLKLLRSAVDLEDSTEKHPVTPGAITPARELLGDMLLELNQPGPALLEFETSLRNSPSRFNGLHGAARSAELAGQNDKARTYYAQLVALCDRSDTTRTELQKAKAFLAKK